MEFEKDPVLKSIVSELKDKYLCHTIILYGSRARGMVTSTSDYDVAGICKKGQMHRIAKKQKGFYWDVFIYSEKDLEIFGEQQRGWQDATILYDKNGYGKKLLKRLTKFLKKRYIPLPQYEINVLKIWAKKEIERCKVKDIHGLYRRTELQSALLEHYFVIRKKRYLGPKAALAWLHLNDLVTFKLIHQSLRHPSNLSYLVAAAAHVYKVKIS